MPGPRTSPRTVQNTRSAAAGPGDSDRLVAVWVVLLALAQLADVVTTGVDMAHGGIEANPSAASLIATGGIVFFWLLKFTLVAGMGLALVTTRRLLRQGGGTPLVRLTHRVAMRGTQLAVVVLTAIVIHNTLLFTGIA